MELICPYCGSKLTVYAEQQIEINISVEIIDEDPVNNIKITEHFSDDGRYRTLNRDIYDPFCRCFENGCYDGLVRTLIQRFPDCIRG